ncbi:MAG: hypothetical protein ACI8ZW_001524, partial [Yoonia sp.]
MPSAKGIETTDRFPFRIFSLTGNLKYESVNTQFHFQSDHPINPLQATTKNMTR